MKEQVLNIFLHIPRTSGKSIKKSIFFYFNGKRGKKGDFILDKFDFLRKIEKSGVPIESNAKHALISHCWYGIHSLFKRKCTYYTILRDPVDRLLFVYSMVSGSKEYFHLYEGLSFENWIYKNFKFGVDNLQTRMLCSSLFPNRQSYFFIGNDWDIGGTEMTNSYLEEAIKNLKSSFCLVGLYENRESYINKIPEIFGFDKEKFRKYSNIYVGNKKNRSFILKKEDLEPELIRYIKNREKYDYILYNYVKDILI